jgi:hypothetical protein
VAEVSGTAAPDPGERVRGARGAPETEPLVPVEISPGRRLWGPAVPADLAAVVAAWPTLPEPVRAGILAMVRASDQGEAKRQEITP